MAPNFCTTPSLRPVASASFLLTSSKRQTQGQAAKAPLFGGTSRNQMLVCHLARICQRLSVRHVSGAVRALSSPDSKAPASLQSNERRQQVVNESSGNGHLAKPSNWERKDETDLHSREGVNPSVSRPRDGPAATRAKESFEKMDGEKAESVADVLAQMRERLKKANGKHCKIPQTSLDDRGSSSRGINGAASQEDKAPESMRLRNSENEDHELRMSLQKSRRLPPMDLPGRIKAKTGSELREGSVYSNTSTRSLHIEPPKEAQTEGRLDVTRNDKQHKPSSSLTKQLPPLKLRSRSQFRKSTDSRNGQALSGLSLQVQAAHDGRLATNGFSYDNPQLSEHVAELRDRSQDEATPSSFLRGEEKTSSAPLIEWRQASLEGAREPLELPPPFQESSALESSVVQSLGELSLKEDRPKDAPLTEWLEMSSNASGSGMPAASLRPDDLEPGGKSSKPRAEDHSSRTESVEPNSESGLFAGGKDAGPLTEWLTQQDSHEAVGSQNSLLQTESAAPLTEWRSQASVVNGGVATQNGAKPQASTVSALSLSEKENDNRKVATSGKTVEPPLVSGRLLLGNGSIAKRKASSGGEMLLAEAATIIKESSSDEEQQRTPEWHALRKWRLTASAFGNAVGCWPDGRLRLWEEKLELRAPFRGNDATAWGTAREPSAIEHYLNVTGNKVCHQAFQIYKEHDEVYTWLGASPDGLIERDSAGIGQGSGVLEVKCPFGKGRPQTAQPYDSVPYYYIPQVQGLLEIFDRQWADVFVWTVNGSVVFRVERARAYWALLFPVLSEFWWQHVIPAKHEMLQGRTDPAYLRNFQPGEEHSNTKLIVAESRRLSANSPAIWTNSGRVHNRTSNRAL